MDKPMMDLSEYTNTDLKLAYGIGNFQTLSEYDETYQTFIQTLSALANAYLEVEDLTRAREVSRLCIDYDPKNRVAYLTLANAYKKEGNSHDLANLKQEIRQSPLPRKESLLREIDH